jgi:hypothetical protein
VYRLLEQELGYVRISKPGTVHLSEQPTLVEVHPHACFVVGLGWVPQNKETLSGQLERAAYFMASAQWGETSLKGEVLPRPDLLAHLGNQLGSTSWGQIRSQGIRLDSLHHDILDSLAGLITLIQCFEGGAFGLGDPDEGVIVLPGEPKVSYSRAEWKADLTDVRH